MTDKKTPNPAGKGGFGDHPENISAGGWKKENVFSYQYRRFMNMSLKEWAEFLNNPPEGMTVVEELAVQAVKRAKSSLKDVQEITDRTEGKAPQFIGTGDKDDYEKVIEALDGGSDYGQLAEEAKQQVVETESPIQD